MNATSPDRMSQTRVMGSGGGLVEQQQQDPPIYYFGYGAMSNPISRKRREIASRGETPAVLRDFKIVFRHAGAAAVDPCEGKEVHGVLMEMCTPDDWRKMVEFEKGYEITEENVFPYGREEPVRARVFRFIPTKEEEDQYDTPQERYIKVITMGLRTYGVNEDYIQENILGIECVPSSKPEDYMKFSVDEKALETKMTWNDYLALCSERPAFVMGKRIVVCECESLPEHRFSLWMKMNMIGKEDAAWRLYQLLLDPDVPVIERKEDLMEIHIRWAEHQILNMMKSAKLGFRASVKAVLESSE